MENQTRQNKDLEREFFDRVSQAPEGYEALGEGSYQKLLHFLKKTAGPREGELMTELGCGSGAFTARLHRAYPRNPIVGVDISPGCIRKASESLPKVRFKVGDITATDFEPNSVDVVIFFAVLHHFPDFRPVAKEAFRILKPGGRFFSYDPHYYNPPLWLYRAKSSPFYSPVGITPNERLMTGREVREVFFQAGFEAHTRIISGIAPDWTESELVRRFVLPAYKIFEAVLGVTQLGHLIGSAVIGWGKKPG